MTRWAYKVLRMPAKGLWNGEFETDDVDYINQLGAEGWEMVSASVVNKGFTGQSSSLLLIFKQELNR